MISKIIVRNVSVNLGREWEWEGESASYPSYGFPLLLRFFSFFFNLLLSLSFARENFPGRVRDTRNVSCVYECGYFSVINECYINRDVFSNREIIMQGGP